MPVLNQQRITLNIKNTGETMTTKPRASVAALPAYSYAPTSVPGVERIIQLGQNELALPPSPEVAKAIEAHNLAFDHNKYGDPEYAELCAAICKILSLNSAGITITAGSVETMNALVKAYLDPGDHVVCNQYGYKYFETIAAIAGVEVAHAPEREFHVDVDAMLNAVQQNTKMLFLVNPNNPTGTRISDSEIRRLSEQLGSEIMLVVDEAYSEFMVDNDFVSSTALVDEGKNVVVLRTFSKAYGLAALRIGWAYAPYDVVVNINKVIPACSVPTLSIAAATAAMLDSGHLRKTCDQIIELRERFRTDIDAIGLQALPANGNFLLMRIPDDWPTSADNLSADDVCEQLKQQGIIVRPTKSFGIPNGLRVTIGNSEEMELLTNALRGIAAVS
jgi:histidinol-phosphate aminotransferase